MISYRKRALGMVIEIVLNGEFDVNAIAAMIQHSANYCHDIEDPIAFVVDCRGMLSRFTIAEKRMVITELMSYLKKHMIRVAMVYDTSLFGQISHGLVHRFNQSKQFTMEITASLDDAYRWVDHEFYEYTNFVIMVEEFNRVRTEISRAEAAEQERQLALMEVNMDDLFVTDDESEFVPPFQKKPLWSPTEVAQMGAILSSDGSSANMVSSSYVVEDVNVVQESCSEPRITSYDHYFVNEREIYCGS